MRKSRLALSLVVAIALPSLAVYAPLEKLVAGIKKLDGKVEVEKVGKTEYLTVTN